MEHELKNRKLGVKIVSLVAAILLGVAPQFILANAADPIVADNTNPAADGPQPAVAFTPAAPVNPLDITQAQDIALTSQETTQNIILTNNPDLDIKAQADVASQTAADAGHPEARTSWAEFLQSCHKLSKSAEHIPQAGPLAAQSPKPAVLSDDSEEDPEKSALPQSQDTLQNQKPSRDDFVPLGDESMRAEEWDPASLTDFLNQMSGPAVGRTGKRSDKRWFRFQRMVDEEMTALDKAKEEEAKRASDPNVIVIDSMEFDKHLRAVFRMLYPPERLHPWLKWLLYSSRVTPQMLEAYLEALDARDRIYKRAVESKGKLKIRLAGRVVDPVFIWPDQPGSYELVMVKNENPTPAEAGQAATPPSASTSPLS